ncbi:hypothetical protein GALL_468980 [mine drainage metagenome]|uniref:Uncharacterized protein n=1 Tax=mine drainage metagenome TaxID=410659 RepID=A0A1J5PV78_9ZZZZ
MHLHGAPLCFLHEKLKCVEYQISAEPHELALAPIDGGPELRRILLPNCAINAVTTDDQVVLGHQLFDRRRFGLVKHLDALSRCASLQYMK